MPLTPEQLAKIAQKDAALPAALKRNATTNYYEGYFFITLNTRNYAPILSFITGRPDAPDDAPDAPACEYTELGRKVMAVWQTVPRFHPQEPCPTTSMDCCDCCPATGSIWGVWSMAL